MQRRVSRGAHPLKEHDLEPRAGRSTDEWTRRGSRIRGEWGHTDEAQRFALDACAHDERIAEPTRPNPQLATGLLRHRAYRPIRQSVGDDSAHPEHAVGPFDSRLDPPLRALTDEDACLVEL